MRIVCKRRFFGAFEHFHIAYLLSAFNVVINNYFIVIQINGAYENVNDTFAEFHIVKIAFAKLL